MTLNEMLEAFCEPDTVPVQAIEAALADWDAHAPQFRAMLRAYVLGEDLSEQTEQSLHVIVHLLAEKADTAAFADICHLAEQSDRFDSVLGPAGAALSFAPILVSTFAGDPAPLVRLIEQAAADDYTRCDGLLVLTYLACTDKTAKAPIYDYLSRLGARLPDYASDIGYGFARAVATLGFAGLSGLVDAAYKQGRIDAIEYTPADFWRDLRDTQAAGPDLSDPVWSGLQPIGSAIDQLAFLASEEAAGAETNGHAGYDVQEPIRNPLRSVGRNDPCPCGSGKKYKKCCLQAAP